MYCSRPVTKKAARPLLSKKPPFNLTKFSDQKNSEIKIMKHFMVVMVVVVISDDESCSPFNFISTCGVLKNLRP